MRAVEDHSAPIPEKITSELGRIVGKTGVGHAIKDLALHRPQYGMCDYMTPFLDPTTGYISGREAVFIVPIYPLQMIMEGPAPSVMA
jgi:hypothetical protein